MTFSDKTTSSLSTDKKQTSSFFSNERKASSQAFFQPKFMVGPVDDVYEREADAVADKVMHKENVQEVQPKITPVVQRKCAACEDEEHIQRKENGGSRPESNTLVGDAINSNGKPLDKGTQSFMEQRMGHDFSSVKIHTNSVAAKSAKAINALAYTSGDNIVFNAGQYAPHTEAGKKLLAHELTHVVQQRHSLQRAIIQRTVHHGSDHAGTYQFDDQACTLQYNEDWYFQFPESTAETQRHAYMGRAERQVESTWSHQHRLQPTSPNCPCHAGGVDVNIDLNTRLEPRRGRHGYSINVQDDSPRAFTNPPLRNLTLAEGDDIPQNFGASQPMPVLAHEFGHTLGITDEYGGWGSFWNVFGLSFGAGDPDSLMHFGNAVRPRHYQHFADLISNEIEGCTYQPQGIAAAALAIPVVQLGITGALSLNNAQFILDLHVDRRIGNTDLLGLATPRLGFNMLLNAANGNIMAGPSIGLSLNRLAHPIYVDLHTGILFDPADPGRPASLNIPASATIGLRGNGFSAGINYTGMIDVLGHAGYTHMLGVNVQFDMGNGR